MNPSQSDKDHPGPYIMQRAGDRSRTRDILITSEALYQLSYTGEAVGLSRDLPAADAIVGDRSRLGRTALSRLMPEG
jgi:hypothetical protein